MSIEPVTASSNLTTYQKAKQKFNNIRTAKPLEKFYSEVKNSADMTDTLIVPRTIFKGYLGIMTGTTLVTIGSLLSKSMPKVSKLFSLAGLATSLYGTYAFVRPYIIKDVQGVATKKNEV